PAMTADEWISVLKLASKWKMLDIRQAAIGALDTQPWLLKIVLAREYGVLTWLQDGYLDFKDRQESLSMNDFQTLGLHTALKLVNMREESLLGNREEVGGWHTQYRRNNSNINSYWAVSNSCSDAVDIELSQELNGANSARGLDAVARVLWARSQNNVQYLRWAYIELTERVDSISLDEASKLGLETTVKICRARERFFRSYPGIHTTNSSTEMETYFGDEFDAVAGMNMLYV
ncbi:hypothetical protein C0992_008292, partial [Termitomyces sp. T32_za158]